MIVMKFGGSSLASPSAIRRVTEIIKRQSDRSPVVVVSAIGDSTDRLCSIFQHGARGESYLARRAQEELQQIHFCLAEDLVSGARLTDLNTFIRQTFRDLHIAILELAEGERTATAELRDWVLSLGELLSSRLVADAIAEAGITSRFFDSRKLVLTDEQHGAARPRIWETYARIRWSIEHAARQAVPVLGGFIGSTEDGRTTTLGRGGSDLSASLIGAALNADEIQFWKDVDGIMSWDPKLKAAPLRVRQLSYEEAAELSAAGARILHPDTVEPARRLRIPASIRCTFQPECEGTFIGNRSDLASGVVKSVVCQRRHAGAVITLIGREINTPAVRKRVQACLTPGESLATAPVSNCSMQISLRDQSASARILQRLAKAFFADVDERVFSPAAVASSPAVATAPKPVASPVGMNARRAARTLVLAHF